VQHDRYMTAALELASRALAQGNLPIGAVIVHDGAIVASGRNAIESARDDTHHAELVAIQGASQFLFAHKHQCTIYTTVEPCMMCLGAIVNVGIDRVVFAATDPLVGASTLLSSSEYYQTKGLQLVGGVLRAQSQALLDEYVARTGFRRHLASGARS